jgi:hypothetical protein
MSKPWFVAADWEPWVWKPHIEPIKLEPAPKHYLNGHSHAAAQSAIQLAPEGYGADAAPIPPMVIPGLVGELVDLCWRSSAYQIAEVSIASALSSMSLLCARSYHFNGRGLNLYLLVLAKTSMGKSFANQSNENWHEKLLKHFEDIKPSAAGHFEYGQRCVKVLKGMLRGNIGSASGLAHHLAENPSTLHYLDEFVNKIKEMGDPRCSPHLTEIRDELLNLVEKAGPSKTYRSRIYSKRVANAVNIPDVKSAALSILATGTPKAFYEAIDDVLLENGFIPRFTILDYEGSLSWPNQKIDRTIPDHTFEQLKWLLMNMVNIDIKLAAGEAEPFIPVEITPEGKDRLHQFEVYSWNVQRSASLSDQPHIGLWSRATMHVSQIASLIAIGCNVALPTITADHVDIAIAIVKPNLDKLTFKVVGHQIGTGDDRLVTELRLHIARVFVGGYAKFKSYTNANQKVLDSGAIQVNVLKMHCVARLPFKNHKMGASRAFDTTLESLRNDGDIEFIKIEGFNGRVISINQAAFDKEIKQINSEA